MKKRSKLQDGIFLVAGVYLVYIAYQLLRELPESMGPRVGLIIAAIVFAVVGVWVAIRSVRGFLPGNQQDESTDEGKEETAEEDEAQTAEEVEDHSEAEIPDSTDQPEDTQPVGEGNETPDEE